MNLNKKAQGLSINTVIITILAIFVLVLVVVALTGGVGNFTKWWNDIFKKGSLTTSEVLYECDGFCANYQNTQDEQYILNYCDKEFWIDTNLDNKEDADEFKRCQDIPTAACPLIDCEIF